MPTPRPPAISPRAERASAPLSFAQRGLWFLDQWAPGNARYNVPFAMAIEGPLDAAALARAVAEVVSRHEILRTTFVADRDEPVQAVSPSSPVQLRIVDNTGVTAAVRERLVRRLLRRDVWQPFDLARGPLLRLTLWRTETSSHVLSATVHHIVADAPSVVLLLHEVTTIYAALVARQPAALPPLPIQYGDYAAWERTRPDGPALERALSYWETQLDGAVALELPLDRQRPAVRTFAGGAEPWAISREQSARLRDLARIERVTLFMVLVAAFGIVLRRYTQQTDVTIGSPVTTRQSRETASLVGLFLNTIVLRLRIDDRRPFVKVLAAARAAVVGAMAHRDVPFERLVERLQPSRHDDNPFFNVMLALLPTPPEQSGVAGLRMTPIAIEEEAIRYDLTLFAREHGDEIGGVLSYSKELFDTATIRRMAAHFERLLGAVVEQPSTPLDELPLLTSAERDEILTRGRGPVVPPPLDPGVHQLFERHVEATPDATAVVRDQQVLSYRDLDRDANQIAHALLALGAGRGARVALCLDRRPPLVAALLATMKAGACYVPLDPTYPVMRLQRIVEEARPRVLLTEKRFASWWADLPNVQVVYLDDGDSTIAAQPTTSPRVAITPDDPVYVIYTSGSTGAPKGVVVPHRGLINSCFGVVEATGIRRADRFLHFAPIGFDVSAFQIFPALIAGAAVVLADPASELSNDDILELCERGGVTILDLPSGVWQQWVTDMAGRPVPLPPAIRVFMTGGEATPMDAVRRWATRVAGSARFISSYGPTETAVATMWVGDAREVPDWRTAAVTLGRPLRNVRLSIVDEAQQPVPVGVAGELCVAGDGLAHGYVDLPELTAVRFVPDPFGGTAGARLYRTGDRARYRADGILEFLGRFDQQLKVRGVRIESGEIEALLRQHPGVRAAVVTTVTPPGGRPLLAAFVVPGDPAPSEAELRQHLAAHLPATVLPAAYCFLAALPITPNGKIDRRALPLPAIADAGRAITAPRTETERLIAALWAEALAVSAVGVDDDFFALGGHSLTAARLASRLREAFDVDLPLRTVFEAPTVAAVARVVDARRRAVHGRERPPLVAVPRTEAMPLSFAQQGFWLLEQVESGHALYANAEVIRLRGAFSVRAFANALTQIVARHEVLRTTFAAVDGAPRQIVGAPQPVGVPVIDLERLPAAHRERAAAAVARVEARTPFDLVRGPLIRAGVIRHAPDDHTLLFTMHHIVSDLWSIGVLMAELSAGYRAALDGKTAHFPELPIQYADYAVWERQRWTDEALDQAVALRRSQIGAIAELQLPTDRPRGVSPRFSGGRLEVPLSDALLERAREAGRREGATLFMSLLAALQTLLHLYTGQESILVAVPVANRDQPATEGLIGYFVNHVLVATRIAADATCRELLARVRAAALDALDQQDLPFEAFVRRVRPERQGSHTPLHRVLFNFGTVPGSRLDFAGVHIDVAPRPAVDMTRFDLQWAFAETDGRVTGVLEYDRELFDAATAEHMVADYLRVLAAFVDTPDRRPTTLDVMTATQQSLALAFNEPL